MNIINLLLLYYIVLVITPISGKDDDKEEKSLDLNVDGKDSEPDDIQETMALIDSTAEVGKLVPDWENVKNSTFNFDDEASKESYEDDTFLYNPEAIEVDIVDNNDSDNLNNVPTATITENTKKPVEVSTLANAISTSNVTQTEEDTNATNNNLEQLLTVSRCNSTDTLGTVEHDCIVSENTETTNNLNVPIDESVEFVQDINISLSDASNGVNNNTHTLDTALNSSDRPEQNFNEEKTQNKFAKLVIFETDKNSNVFQNSSVVPITANRMQEMTNTSVANNNTISINATERAVHNNTKNLSNQIITQNVVSWGLTNITNVTNQNEAVYIGYDPDNIPTHELKKTANVTPSYTVVPIALNKNSEYILLTSNSNTSNNTTAQLGKNSTKEFEVRLDSKNISTTAEQYHLHIKNRTGNEQMHDGNQNVLSIAFNSTMNMEASELNNNISINITVEPIENITKNFPEQAPILNKTSTNISNQDKFVNTEESVDNIETRDGNKTVNVTNIFSATPIGLNTTKNLTVEPVVNITKIISDPVLSNALNILLRIFTNVAEEKENVNRENRIVNLQTLENNKTTSVTNSFSATPVALNTTQEIENALWTNDNFTTLNNFTVQSMNNETQSPVSLDVTTSIINTTKLHTNVNAATGFVNVQTNIENEMAKVPNSYSALTNTSTTSQLYKNNITVHEDENHTIHVSDDTAVFDMIPLSFTKIHNTSERHNNHSANNSISNHWTESNNGTNATSSVSSITSNIIKNISEPGIFNHNTTANDTVEIVSLVVGMSPESKLVLQNSSICCNTTVEIDETWNILTVQKAPDANVGDYQYIEFNDDDYEEDDGEEFQETMQFLEVFDKTILSNFFWV